MLRKPTIEEVEAYLDRAYALALDPTRSGYPTYLDGIKTKMDFEKTVRWGQREERSYRLLVYEENEKPAGLICFFTLTYDDYLQTVIFNIEGDTNRALAEFEAYCREEFPGYGLNLGFPKDNQAAVSYFEENGWDLIERSYNDVFHFADYEPVASDAPVMRITRENFSVFRQLHEKMRGRMYWNVDRLYENLEQWSIWVYCQKETPLAAIYYTNEGTLMEVFGVDFLDGIFDENAFRVLLRKVLNDCKESGCRHMVFFNDDESQKAVLDMGFTCVGEYLLFVKMV